MTPIPSATRSSTASARGHRAAAGEGDRLRDELLDAAERLLLDAGSVDSVSLRQVAREVGVSATSVYLHFADKEHLMLEVCRRRFGVFAEYLREAREAAADGGPAAMVRACGRAYVQFGLDNPGHYKVLFGELKLEEVMERLSPDEMVGLQALQELAGVVQLGVEQGVFRPVDPYQTALALWATVHGLVGIVDHCHGTPVVDPESTIEHTLDLVARGLEA